MIQLLPPYPITNSISCEYFGGKLSKDIIGKIAQFLSKHETTQLTLVNKHLFLTGNDPKFILQRRTLADDPFILNSDILQTIIVGKPHSLLYCFPYQLCINLYLSDRSKCMQLSAHNMKYWNSLFQSLYKIKFDTGSYFVLPLIPIELMFNVDMKHPLIELDIEFDMDNPNMKWINQFASQYHQYTQRNTGKIRLIEKIKLRYANHLNSLLFLQIFGTNYKHLHLHDCDIDVYDHGMLQGIFHTQLQQLTLCANTIFNISKTIQLHAQVSLNTLHIIENSLRMTHHNKTIKGLIHSNTLHNLTKLIVEINGYEKIHIDRQQNWFYSLLDALSLEYHCDQLSDIQIIVSKLEPDDLNILIDDLKMWKYLNNQVSDNIAQIHLKIHFATKQKGTRTMNNTIKSTNYTFNQSIDTVCEWLCEPHPSCDTSVVNWFFKL